MTIHHPYLILFQPKPICKEGTKQPVTHLFSFVPFATRNDTLMYLAAKQMWWSHCICKNSSWWDCFLVAVHWDTQIATNNGSSVVPVYKYDAAARRSRAPPSKTTSRQSWPPTAPVLTKQAEGFWSPKEINKQENMATSIMLRTVLPVVFFAVLLSGESRGLTSLLWKQNLAP